MVRRRISRWSLAVLTLGLMTLAGRPALADKNAGGGLVTFTGDVENDMPSGVIPGSQIVDAGPANRVAQAKWITDTGWTTGWAMKDVRFNYDAKSDTMQVGINFYGIAGDADGNGDPGKADPRTTAAGGIDLPNLGGRKSITLALAPDGPSGPNAAGVPVAIAGVSADKSKAGAGIDGFNVAQYTPSNAGIAYNYGKTLTDNVGSLAFNPSAAHPDFEFSLKNFSKIPGLNTSNGFWFQTFAGSPDDVVAGEESVGWLRMNGQFSPQTVPEPATWLAWGAVATLAAAWRRRRYKAASTLQV